MADRNRRALEVMQKSGVFNPGLTLEHIMKISLELESLGGGIEVAEWTFAGPNWVYTGSANALNAEVIR